MKKVATVILQVGVVLLGLVAVAFLLWEPHLEGRNAHHTFTQVYFKDPFLVYVYLASIPFFVGLRQAFKILGSIGRGRTLSPPNAKALRTLKICAWITFVFALLGIVFMLLSESDDHAGGVFMGLLVLFSTTLTGLVAGRFERMVRKRIQITEKEVP